MESELHILILTSILAALHFMPYLFAYVFVWGLPVAAGNRAEPMPALPAWADRARRAHANMVENFPHFAALVLAAHALDVSNGYTLLGAQIFLWARAAYLFVYIAGIPWIRTLLFITGLTGEGMIALQLLTAP